LLKDIVFHLEIGAALDATANYAISVAQAYGAYLEGMAFAYHPVLPPPRSVAAFQSTSLKLSVLLSKMLQGRPSPSSRTQHGATTFPARAA
jgi:hypothetical protein